MLNAVEGAVRIGRVLTSRLQIDGYLTADRLSVNDALYGWISDVREDCHSRQG